MQNDDLVIASLCKNVLAFLQLNEVHIRRGGPKAIKAMETLSDEAIAVVELMETNTFHPTRPAMLERTGFDIRVLPGGNDFHTVSAFVNIPADADGPRKLRADHAMPKLLPTNDAIAWNQAAKFAKTLREIGDTLMSQIAKERAQ